MPRPSGLLTHIVLVWLIGCSGDDDKATTDTGPDTTDTGTVYDPNDRDGDGADASEDCDDDDPTRYPGAQEHCDGVDQNCVDDEELDVVTVLPSQSFATLAEAAAVAIGGETVQVCPGTYLGSTTFEVPITVVGIPSTDSTGAVVRPLLDGDGGGATLRLDGAGSHAEGLAITGGTKGGLVVGFGADADLVDLDVYDNINDFGGGVQFSQDGGSLSSSTVRDNIAQEDGGGVYASGNVTLTDVQLTGNVATTWGGGLLIGEGGTLTLEGVDITGNNAERGGGVFALADTTVDATDVVVEGNSASASGGGVYLLTTDWAGNATLLDNDAVDTGGGLYVYDGGSVLGIELTGNQATVGGGLFASGVLTLDLTVSDNQADTDGGGAYLLDADATLGSSTFSGNDAPDGGGLYLQDSSISGGVVSANGADNGAGLFVANVDDGYTTVIDGTVIEDNTASTSGGGLYLPNDTDLVDVFLLRNLSEDRAGGMYVTNSAEVSVEGAVVQSNTAVQRGGGLYANTDSTVELVDSELTRNQALRGGGIYINNESTVDLTDCDVHTNGDPTTLSGGGVRVITGNLVSVTSNWGEGPEENQPDDVYTELGPFDGFLGYGALETFSCDTYGCTPEP